MSPPTSITELRVDCVWREDGRIVAVGGLSADALRWRLSLSEAARRQEAGSLRLFAQPSDGSRVVLVADVAGGVLRAVDPTIELPDLAECDPP